MTRRMRHVVPSASYQNRAGYKVATSAKSLQEYTLNFPKNIEAKSLVRALP